MSEEVPPKARAAKTPPDAPWLRVPDRDPRQPALRVDVGCIKVHRVMGVQFTFEEFPVSRYRRERKRSKF